MIQSIDVISKILDISHGRDNNRIFSFCKASCQHKQERWDIVTPYRHVLAWCACVPMDSNSYVILEVCESQEHPSALLLQMLRHQMHWQLRPWKSQRLGKNEEGSLWSKRKATSLPRMRCLLCMRMAIHGAGNAEREELFQLSPWEVCHCSKVC